MSDSTDTVVLRAGDLEATWVPAAGMVGASLRHRGDELLGQRGGLEAYVERGSTFGIPLLHPWANRLGADRFAVGDREVHLPPGAAPVRREEHGLPIHGLLAASRAWRVTAAEHGALTARLAFGGDLLELFPFPHELVVAVALDERGLEVSTSVEAVAGPVPIAFGWHPYLAPPGAARADWVLELPARRRLATDDRGLPTGASEPVGAERAPLGDRTFDDGYDQLAAPVLALEAGGRRIAVTLGDGYRVTQVFAPANQDLVALEPMTAPTDALRTGRAVRWAAAGEAVTATFRLDVEDLAGD
jgi:aldose 1-epimerase